MSVYKAPKGTRDVLPEESYRWQYLEKNIRRIVAKYGLQEVRTPVIEQTELFLRGVGDTTDIVQKEMYTFDDKGGRSITLKPEGTAGVARMFTEHNLFAETQPTKMFYLYSPTFRYERPQAGRLREHHQFGVEIFGSALPTADAECIAIAMELLDSIGCKDLSVRINSIGCPNCRPKYHAALTAYLESRRGELCETCNTRLVQNPLRVLDCKVPICAEIAKQAPAMEAYLCPDCKQHMDALKSLLDSMGIRFAVTPTLVRGLDYYTRTVFEVVSEDIGAQSAVCGGGRYDGLVEQVGGKPTPAVGFGLGMERLLLLMDNAGIEIPVPLRYELYIASMGASASEKAFLLTHALRASGHSVEMDHMARSVKAQLKYADKIMAKYVLVIGDDELARGTGRLKRMSDGSELDVKLDANEIDTILIRGE